MLELKDQPEPIHIGPIYILVAVFMCGVILGWVVKPSLHQTMQSAPITISVHVDSPAKVAPTLHAMLPSLKEFGMIK